MNNIPGKTEKELNKDIVRLRKQVKKDIEAFRISFNQKKSISLSDKLIDKIKYFFKRNKNV